MTEEYNPYKVNGSVVVKKMRTRINRLEDVLNKQLPELKECVSQAEAMLKGLSPAPEEAKEIIARLQQQLSNLKTKHKKELYKYEREIGRYRFAAESLGKVLLELVPLDPDLGQRLSLIVYLREKSLDRDSIGRALNISWERVNQLLKEVERRKAEYVGKVP